MSINAETWVKWKENVPSHDKGDLGRMVYAALATKSPPSATNIVFSGIAWSKCFNTFNGFKCISVGSFDFFLNTINIKSNNDWLILSQ